MRKCAACSFNLHHYVEDYDMQWRSYNVDRETLRKNHDQLNTYTEYAD